MCQLMNERRKLKNAIHDQGKRRQRYQNPNKVQVQIIKREWIAVKCAEVERPVLDRFRWPRVSKELIGKTGDASRVL